MSAQEDKIQELNEQIALEIDAKYAAINQCDELKHKISELENKLSLASAHAAKCGANETKHLAISLAALSPEQKESLKQSLIKEFGLRV